MKKKASEKRGRGRPPVREVSQGERIQLRALADEKKLFEAAAKAAGLSMSDWIRDRLGKVARRELKRQS